MNLPVTPTFVSRAAAALLAVVPLLGAAAVVARAQPRPPNLVVVMADDLGYGDLGSYGQRHIRTPHLDRMAEEGTRFTQFYAGSTVCAPSRSVLMTGRHTGHTYVRGNRPAEPYGQFPLADSIRTVAEVLGDAGYVSGMFGKWGLGVEETEGAPVRQGFDAFFGYLDQVHAHFYHVDHLWAIEEGRLARVAVDSAAYAHDLIFDAALSFVDANRDRPFFLYLPVTIPHAELVVPEASLAAYRGPDGRSIFPETPFAGGHYAAQPMPHAAYAAMVSHLDRDVGRLLDRLERHGLADDTIVMFTSDNGPHEAGGYDYAFLDGNGLLRGGKRDLYEGGIRVPMIAWGPGTVPAGRVSDQVWAAWDVLPTLAALAGTPAPERVDGISMVNALTGRPYQLDHEYLYWEFYERGSAQAIRAGRWKAVRRPMLTGRIELYDLESDLAEAHDVADAHPDVVARLRRLMGTARTPSAHWP